MPRHRLRALLILLVVCPQLLTIAGCINANALGTKHLPPDTCRAGQEVKVEFVITMAGMWVGGRRTHVGKVECVYRDSPDEDFTRKAMTYSGEIHDGELQYDGTVPVRDDAAGNSLEYFFEFEVDQKTYSRGSESEPTGPNAKATPFRVPIES